MVLLQLGRCCGSIAAACMKHGARRPVRNATAGRLFSSKRYFASTSTSNDESTIETTTPSPSTATGLWMWGTDESTTGSTKIIKNARFESTQVFDFPTRVLNMDFAVSKVTCGPTDTAFLLENGTCLVMGENKQGQLGLGHKNPVTSPTEVVLLNQDNEKELVKHVSLGMNFSAFVSTSGNLYTCGFGGSAFSGMGCLGHGNADSVLIPTLVESLIQDGCTVDQVQVGELHMTCLTTEGEVLSTGAASYGRLGNYDTSTDQLYLEPVEMLTPSDGIVTIAGGKSFTLALTKDGVVYSWGRNHKGQLGTGLGLAVDMYAMQAVPEPIQADELVNRKIKQIAAGHSHAACIAQTGEMFYWGMSQHFDPVLANELLHTKVVDVACGQDYTLILDHEGHLYSWGTSKATFGRNNGVLGQGPNVTRLHSATLVQALQLEHVTVKQISAGWKHAACLGVVK